MELSLNFGKLELFWIFKDVGKRYETPSQIPQIYISSFIDVGFFRVTPLVSGSLYFLMFSLLSFFFLIEISVKYSVKGK